MHRLIAVLAIPLCLACTRGVRPDAPSGPARAFRLLGAVEEKESERFTERRDDMDFEGSKVDRPPRVVARGETEAVRLEGARARLYGDSEGTRGFSVDNVLLLEAVAPSGGAVLGRAVVGFCDGLSLGNERIDNIGRMSFTFDGGEIDLTRILPEDAPFILRATVLDSGGVGKVSDVFLKLEPRSASGEQGD
jgi:hypothetical protein